MTHSASDNTQTSPFSYWLIWFALMQQLFQGTVHNNEHKHDSTWVQALDLWWQALQPQLPQEHEAVYRRFIEQGKSYFRLNGEFLHAFQNMTATEDATAWKQQWEIGFAQLHANYQALLDEQQKQSTLGFWTQPLESWQDIVNNLSSLPPELLPQLAFNPSMQDQQHIQTQLNAWLSIPALGHQREWQERLKKGIRLQLDYQQAQQAYSAVFGQIGLHAIEKMHNHILAPPEDSNKPINNLRDIYDLWIMCGEVAYAEIVSSQEYAQIYADLINKLMAWKKHEQGMLDDMLGLLNMPTRRELNGLHQRIQQMRRETKATQNEHLALCDAARYELDALRVELDALKRQHDAASLCPSTAK